MVELTWQTTTHGSVTFIAATLDNRGAVSGVEGHRVRIEINAAGDVWPPVDGQLPATEWTDGNIETTVAVEEKIGIGVACEGPIEDPPLTITNVTPATPEKTTIEPIDVLRELGDPTPPKEAIPLPDGVDEPPATESSPSERAPVAVEEQLDGSNTTLDNNQDPIRDAHRTHLEGTADQSADATREIKTTLRGSR